MECKRRGTRVTIRNENVHRFEGPVGQDQAWVGCAVARDGKRRGCNGDGGQLTLPMITRPRPPFGAHSSLAMRSSLLGRSARHIVVTLCPF